jgi:DNA-binding XRE family transcriptional regulator
MSGERQADLPQVEILNASARLSLWVLDRGGNPLRTAVVRHLMTTHGWTSVRAWRHWRRYSKAEMARRLGVHLCTYEVIEEGEVDLGPWLLPAVERALLKHEGAGLHGNGNVRPLQGYRRI